MTNGASQGLFVIVAVVIFGIFVLISYMLFRDNLKPSLSSIFTDSLEQVEKNLNGENDGNINGGNDGNITGGAENTVRYVLLREAYDTHSDIYAEVKDNETGGVTIIGVSKTADGEYIKDNNYSSPLGLTGEISFDKKINGKNITEIEDGVFQYSTFTGDFNAPNVTSIGEYAFLISNFSGEFNAPKLTSIGENALSDSTFSGNFNAPNVTSIGLQAFRNSNFSGDFNTPNVTSIGQGAFYNSKFSGNFNAPNVTSIRMYAFLNSTFTSAYAPNLETIESDNGTLNTLLKK